MVASLRIDQGVLAILNHEPGFFSARYHKSRQFLDTTIRRLSMYLPTQQARQ
jgi:hypothetical protein